MTERYRLFGSELSPYSVKVRSYLRYKGIPHEWVPRTAANQAEFDRYARLPLIPLLVTPEDTGLQDSTPIIEALEDRFPEPSIHPSEPAGRFLSALLEEFADEWGNKWMFHYRWARDVDQESAARRLAEAMLPDAAPAEREEAARAIRARMVDRVWYVGSSAETAPQIEDSYRETLELLEAHLRGRPYLFGARPAFADFGLWGQLYECFTDPTAGGLLRELAPAVVAWIERMREPAAAGAFEGWRSLAATLEPVLARQVGRLFLPWSDANARALATGSDEVVVELDGRLWRQRPQKYHARSLAALRERFARTERSAELEAALERTGCLRWLRAP